MPIPRITNDTERRTLTFVWPDGVSKVFGWAHLRVVCPCALCRDERRQQESSPLTLTPRSEDTLADVQFVGRYAVQLTWADGHAFGIYSWKMLRELPEDGTGDED